MKTTSMYQSLAWPLPVPASATGVGARGVGPWWAVDINNWWPRPPARGSVASTNTEQGRGAGRSGSEPLLCGSPGRGGLGSSPIYREATSGLGPVGRGSNHWCIL